MGAVPPVGVTCSCQPSRFETSLHWPGGLANGERMPPQREQDICRHTHAVGPPAAQQHGVLSREATDRTAVHAWTAPCPQQWSPMLVCVTSQAVARVVKSHGLQVRQKVQQTQVQM